jgi:hypothetical protein
MKNSRSSCFVSFLLLLYMIGCVDNGDIIERKEYIVNSLRSQPCEWKSTLSKQVLEWDRKSDEVVFFLVEQDGVLGRTGFRFRLTLNDKNCVITSLVENYNY